MTSFFFCGISDVCFFLRDLLPPLPPFTAVIWSGLVEKGAVEAQRETRCTIYQTGS